MFEQMYVAYRVYAREVSGENPLDSKMHHETQASGIDRGRPHRKPKTT